MLFKKYFPKGNILNVRAYTIKLIATNVDGERKEISKTVVIKEGINIAFTHEIIKSNYSPVEVVLKNTTIGEGLTFKWDFQDGAPATFTGKTPPNVVFTTSGDHTITLTVSNGFESEKQTQTITVAPYLVSLFSYEPKLEDDDYEAPVTINLLTNRLVRQITNGALKAETLLFQQKKIQQLFLQAQAVMKLF